jgi:hypothetical protein
MHLWVQPITRLLFDFVIFASGGPSGGPDFKNLDKWVWVRQRIHPSYIRLSNFSKVWPPAGPPEALNFFRQLNITKSNWNLLFYPGKLGIHPDFRLSVQKRFQCFEQFLEIGRCTVKAQGLHVLVFLDRKSVV